LIEIFKQLLTKINPRVRRGQSGLGFGEARFRLLFQQHLYRRLNTGIIGGQSGLKLEEIKRLKEKRMKENEKKAKSILRQIKIMFFIYNVLLFSA